MIYLDHNSTTPIAPEVAAAMAQCHAEGFVNPASQHGPGRAARRKLEEAREGTAEILGAKTTGMDADTVIFTSGGTESNNLALFGLAGAHLQEGDALAEPPSGSTPQEGRAPALVISSIEHPSVVGPAEALARRGWRLHRLPVSAQGVVDVDHVCETLETSSETPRAALFSVMLGNNETGVLQPVPEIAAACRQAGVPLHTDAVQVAGKLPVNFRELGVEAMTVSAHKFHGPRGIGALIVRHGVELTPTLHGGFQQASLRPGTEDVSLAVGMHKGLELWQAEADERRRRMEQLRDLFEQQLRAGDPSVVVNGRDAPRLPHTSNISFPGIDRQAMLMALDMAGVACSTGSACASGSSEPSPVLLAMGCDEEVISGSLRFSLGAGTTAADIEKAAGRILRVAHDLRRAKNGSFAAATSRDRA